jgi:hypothetical protein
MLCGARPRRPTARLRLLRGRTGSALGRQTAQQRRSKKHRRQFRQAAGAIAVLKNNRPTDSVQGGPFVADEVRTTVVLSVCWTACTFRVVPHVASDERCAVPHAASDERSAAPHAASPDLVAARRAVVAAVSWSVLEWWVLQRLALGRLAVPEPQRLTSSARWSARQGPKRRDREG